jgi:hypothetical protein
MNIDKFPMRIVTTDSNKRKRVLVLQNQEELQIATAFRDKQYQSNFKLKVTRGEKQILTRQADMEARMSFRAGGARWSLYGKSSPKRFKRRAVPDNRAMAHETITKHISDVDYLIMMIECYRDASCTIPGNPRLESINYVSLAESVS